MKNKRPTIIALSATLTLGIASIGTTPTTANANAHLVKSVTTPSYKTTSLKDFRTVKNTSSVYIYSKPSIKSAKLQKLPKNSAVVITSKKSGSFTKIRYIFGYAYIKTAHLSKATPANNAPLARDISKKYHYELPYNNGSRFNNKFNASFTKVYAPNKAVQNFWLYHSEPDQKGVVEFDTTRGLYMGDIENGYLSLAVKYPTRKNATWSGSYGNKSRIISTKSTVKTTAGTFKNVVIVKNSGNYSYFAPNKGLILLKNKHKKTIMKLIK
ncbi:SH3 domain-containing protein [Kurthia sibirica]|uniref:SH3b domain-containing protein n=1 Tax=Kurthia sibirica TaxID=202750 RepID=A0A2U3AIZ9_9BACL|nr:SH3 domain-containing protein [Kurthia sibirica]PWI24523.1 hypothetical protein DEX24_13100 [Kurthia sibirica]GEK33592.1 hypothetical protein KSI01_11250 [Kurthia sibirica]